MKTTIISLLVLLFTFAGFAGDAKAVAAGDKAPLFTLKNYDGKDVSLQKTLADHAFTVVMFISTRCPVSNGYNERMASLGKAYADKKVAVIGVNANVAEDMKEIAGHSKEHGFLFPVVKDVSNKIADQYGAQVTPEVYVIDAKGVVQYHGRIDDSRNPDKVSVKDLTVALDN